MNENKVTKVRLCPENDRLAICPDEIEIVINLCRAFDFGLVITKDYYDDKYIGFYYDIYYSYDSFLDAGYPPVIMAFVLQHNLIYVHSQILRMTELEFLDLQLFDEPKEEECRHYSSNDAVSGI